MSCVKESWLFIENFNDLSAFSAAFELYKRYWLHAFKLTAIKLSEYLLM